MCVYPELARSRFPEPYTTKETGLMCQCVEGTTESENDFVVEESSGRDRRGRFQGPLQGRTGLQSTVETNRS